MVAVLRDVMEVFRPAVENGDNSVHASVVIQVAEREAAMGGGLLEIRAGLTADVLKFSVP